MKKYLGKRTILYALLFALITLSSLSYSTNIINNGEFTNGYFPWEPPGWWAGGNGTYAVDEQGRFCTTITQLGQDDWGAQLRQSNLTFVSGEPYDISLRAWSSTPMEISMSAVDESSGFVWIFGSLLSIDAPLEGEGQEFNLSFIAQADSQLGKFRFLLGAGAVPENETVCFDNIVVDGPFEEEEPEAPISPVHVNQVGYLPYSTKQASYALPTRDINEDFFTPRSWSLIQDEQIRLEGLTSPHGMTTDSASGDLVHTIDFSSYNTTGNNYTLVVNEGDLRHISEPFSISADIYSQLKYDALAYFYHNRSNTPILAELIGDALSRPAGHESDNNVKTIACLELGDTHESCISLDASGGWYDAGDHGKYVVNGGISIWTLLNQYERFLYLGEGVDDFADGTMNLPIEESTNTINDLLDEARWELEWFLKMQVSAGQPLAGMVYHKMHDESWTGLPMAPHDDPKVRYVHPPSTAATLNFAAVGAQCYRTYRDIDREFAERCLSQAMSAYWAARVNPILLANPESSGGGAYDDNNVEDEFYWAASELYTATGFHIYAKEMSASALHLSIPSDGLSLMSWQQVNALGIISLATVGDRFVRKHQWPFFGRGANKIHRPWVTKSRKLIIDAADKYVEASINEGYAVPMSGETYPWGSNASVVNNMIALGLAHDFSCDDQYINAMISGADYLLGRNPLGHSYVTGYGTRSERYPHHRFWAGALSPDYPLAPAGALSGGPNSGLQDPIAAGLLAGCSPQRCFVDHIEAWSVNEITINWNAPLSWVSAYLDEYAQNQGSSSKTKQKPKHKPNKNQCANKGQHTF